MSVRNLVLTASTALMLAGAAHAGELRPTQGQTLDLGGVLGVAYYTVEPDGYHVVATLTDGEAGALTPGQAVTLSSPAGEGGALRSVEFSRLQDHVLVRAATATN
jgi:hypothetical protein